MFQAKRFHLLCLAVIMGAVFFSCGEETPVTPPVPPVLPQTEVERACAAGIFGFGQPISYADLLRSYEKRKYALESVLFRNVLYRGPDEVESAYLFEAKMKLHEGQFLVPEHRYLCTEIPRPSRRTQQLATSRIPVIGDLHLPSTRITVFDTNEGDRLYNYPRISELSVSSSGYSSFNQTWMSNRPPYRWMKSLSDYLDVLRTRHFYRRIDLRVLGPDRIAIVAEKNIRGEIAQLMVTMVAVH